MYYLQSRYYSPAIGRFISADSYAITYETPVGANMFAYCGNNPVSSSDYTGEFWNYVVGAAIGATINLISSYASAKMSGDSYDGIDALSAITTGAVSGMLTASPLSKVAITAINTVALLVQVL